MSIHLQRGIAISKAKRKRAFSAGVGNQNAVKTREQVVADVKPNRTPGARDEARRRMRKRINGR